MPHLIANGRHIYPGTELKISGERGRFRFRQHVVTPAGAEWIDCIGGPKGCQQWRSFRPDRIRRVHRKRETITGAEAKALVKEKRKHVDQVQDLRRAA